MRAISACFLGIALLALAAGPHATARAATSQETLQFDVALAPFCLSGTFRAVIADGKNQVQATVALQVDSSGKPTGTLTAGADVFTLTGTQTVKKGVLSVVLNGKTSGGATIRLSGKSKGLTLTGSASGTLGGAKMPRGSAFLIEMAPASALVARCVVDATIDDSTGAVSGTGTATLCGVQSAVTLSGTTTLPAALATGKPATAKLTVAGSAFTWSGKGIVTLDDEAAGTGFVVNWSGKGNGVKGSGKNLRVVVPTSGTSPAQLALDASLAGKFAASPLDVVVDVTNAVPSGYPADYSVTVNGAAFAGAVSIDAAHGKIVIPETVLEDGKNAVVVVGKDSMGLSFTGSVVVWFGTHALVVTVDDASSAPVANADVVASLGDDQTLFFSGKTDASGHITFNGVPDRTMIVTATGPSNSFGTTADVGSVGAMTVVLLGFDAASAIDNSDFATGDASGWNLGTAPTAIQPHVEDVGPTKAATVDNDLALETSGEGPQHVSRTFDTKPTTTAVKLRYRFVTSEVPGGFFGTKYNDYFSVSIRSMTGGGNVSENDSMNGLGLAAFDAGGATDWREKLLPVSVAGDRVQIDVTVANVGDGLYDSYVVVDSVQEIQIDLKVSTPNLKLLDANRFEITVSPAGAGSDFKMEIRRASSATWYQLGTNQIEAAFKERVAGTFKMRGKATISGVEQTSQEKDLVVAFPAYADVVGSADVRTMTDNAWTSTKNAATATTRREEGFFILLNTNSGVEKYQASATVLGPSVGPNQTGSVNITKPADNPATPTPIQSAIYAVASFHTHTPTRFRPVGRAVGPSGADQTADTNDDVPGVVYDYVGNAAGNAPAGWPLNSRAQRYHSGPNRRTTPP